MKTTPQLLVVAIIALIAMGCGKSSAGEPPVAYYIPIVKIDSAMAITDTSATIIAEVTSDGGTPILSKGVEALSNSGVQTFDTGAGSGKFSINLTKLKPYTNYTIHAFATNKEGIAYSKTSLIFSTTHTYGPNVIDYDGNVYHSIKIGTQVWLLENLKVTHYCNGDPIPNITDANSWGNLTTGAYCNYNNDTSVVKTYGRLYNWYAATDPRGIAPKGWHVPDIDEWITLSNYLGGQSVASGKLKEVGTVHWIAPNDGATNSSGFTALPNGARANPAYGPWQFLALGEQATFWSITPLMPGMNASYSPFLYDYDNKSKTGTGYYLFDIAGGCDNTLGMGIRLLQD